MRTINLLLCIEEDTGRAVDQKAFANETPVMNVARLFVREELMAFFARKAISLKEVKYKLYIHEITVPPMKDAESLTDYAQQFSEHFNDLDAVNKFFHEVTLGLRLVEQRNIPFIESTCERG